MKNIALADHIICVSRTNLAALKKNGIDRPFTVIPEGVHSLQECPKDKPSFADGLMRLIFLSRFVKHKGVTDLLEALPGALAALESSRIVLSLVGNSGLSDAEIYGLIPGRLAALKEAIPVLVAADLFTNLTEAEKWDIVGAADIFVLPSYHEGFSRPVIEAFSAGCRVVTYDNSNLPAIGGGFSRLVPTGNTDELSAAIAAEVRTVSSPSWRGNGYKTYVESFAGYLERFRPETAAKAFLGVIDFVGKKPGRRPGSEEAGK
jgi:glycosyltransferase involved in cell wall biosynthesis